MFHIALCDDNPIILEKFYRLLTKILHNKSIEADVFTFESGESLISFLEKGDSLSFDLVFLDIEMKELSGFETAKRLEQQFKMKNIIFLSSSNEYAMSEFQASALAFIFKFGVTEESFEKTFLDIYFKVESMKNKIKMTPTDNQEKIVSYEYQDASYARYKNQKVMLGFASKELVVEVKWDALCVLLYKQTFVSLNDCLVINVAHIERVSENQIIFINGIHLDIQKGEDVLVKKALMHFLSDI